MIIICTVCRQPNGVACPHCGHRASPTNPKNPERSLYTCNRRTCLRATRPFTPEEGGITHRRHQSCPPTNRLEQIQDTDEEHLSAEDRANAKLQTDEPKGGEG